MGRARSFFFIFLLSFLISAPFCYSGEDDKDDVPGPETNESTEPVYWNPNAVDWYLMMDPKFTRTTLEEDLEKKVSVIRKDLKRRLEKLPEATKERILLEDERKMATEIRKFLTDSTRTWRHLHDDLSETFRTQNYKILRLPRGMGIGRLIFNIIDRFHEWLDARASDQHALPQNRVGYRIALIDFLLREEIGEGEIDFTHFFRPGFDIQKDLWSGLIGGAPPHDWRSDIKRNLLQTGRGGLYVGAMCVGAIVLASGVGLYLANAPKARLEATLPKPPPPNAEETARALGRRLKAELDEPDPVQGTSFPKKVPLKP